MKKRILLSLVSFFMMTAMWASIKEAYQIYVTAGANGKTGATAELTLNMKNRNAIWTWECTLALPEGVTFESAEIADGRYPEGYEAVLKTTVNADGTVTIACSGAEGVALTNTDGAVATVKVKVAADVQPGDVVVTVVAGKTKLVETDTTTIHTDEKAREYTWTIEQGAEPAKKGDVNGDGSVDISDVVEVLARMANNIDGDVNGDGVTDISDVVEVLALMAQQ